MGIASETLIEPRVSVYLIDSAALIM
jgi:hypothetical protein